MTQETRLKIGLQRCLAARQVEARERQQALKAAIDANPYSSRYGFRSQMAQRFHVSPNTIARDLAALAEAS